MDKSSSKLLRASLSIVGDCQMVQALSVQGWCILVQPVSTFFVAFFGVLVLNADGVQRCWARVTARLVAFSKLVCAEV